MTRPNVLLISIDSLRCDVLGAYCEQPRGFGYAVDTPNLDRFADRAAVFDTHYAGSLPCMPARREWLTGTREFLWRPWGPIEPFDDPLPRVARRAGVVTKLITDHFHYFQHGSHGYIEDFNGYEFVRGHELDPWQTTPIETDERFNEQLEAGETRDLSLLNRIVYARNTAEFSEEKDWFAPRVFSRTAEWLRENTGWNQWFCYIDSFDVHEPFDVPEPYASMYTDEDPTDPDLPVWPQYGRIAEDGAAMDGGQFDAGDADGASASELHPERSHGSRVAYTERQVDFVRAQFAGKTTMVDRWFGQVLDALEEEGYWEDTVVIVTSDHGHFLGDHGYMGKPYAPLYDVLAKTPLFVWHPESDRMGERISALTAAVDLYATIADALGAEVSAPHGNSLLPVLQGTTSSVREWALYGYWGSSVNVTDGQYTYFHPTEPGIDAGMYSTMVLNHYPEVLYPPEPDPSVASGQFLPYSDAPVWRTEESTHSRHDSPMLFDVEADPGQTTDLAGQNRPVEERMRSLLVEGLQRLDAPTETFHRLDLPHP